MNGSARIRNAVFSVATVLALGFGAAQAFAAPQAPSNTAEMACSQTNCYYYCRSIGFMSGLCENDLCECYGRIQP